MEKIVISRVVIVEGKYDKIKLDSILEAMIVATDGFRIYHNREKLAMLRAVAAKQGALIATDSDVAGFRIRGFLRSALRDIDVAHVYIPQREGKERRKESPGAEGLLGVEGIDAAELRALFLPFAESPQETPGKRKITRIDFYEDGLLGGENSAEKRARLLQKLDLPGYVSSKGLLEIVNRLMDYDEYREFIRLL
jgi:ribonuclease M5